MTPAQIVWLILVAAMAVVNAPFLIALLTGKTQMPILDQVNAALVRMDAAIAAIPDAVAAKVTAGEAAANIAQAQDNADTIAAVEARAAALEAAVAV